MNWIKQGYTGVAYRQTLQRIDIIMKFVELNGFGKSIQSRMEQELKSLSKLIYGSDKRRKVHRAYEVKMEKELERRHKKEDS